MPVPGWPGIVLLLGGLGLFAGAWYAYTRRARLLDLPTSKVRSMAIGGVELKGVAAPAPGREMLVAPFTHKPCVAWSYEVEEQRTRTVTTTVNGKTQTRTETYWATVASGRSKEPFGLTDDTGTARVDPQGAAVPGPERAQFGSGWGRDPPERVLAFLRRHHIEHEGIFGINKRMRYTERLLPAGTALLLHGNVVQAPDAPASAHTHDALVVVREGETPFMLSTTSEEALVARWSVAFWLMLLGGIAAAGGGAYLLAGGPG